MIIFLQVLRFFRINDPYRLLAVLLIMIVIGIVFIIDRPPLTILDLKSFLLGEAIGNGQKMYTQIIDTSAPLLASLMGAVDWLFGRSVVARQIIALFLLFLQASFFAILLINNKAYNDSTYVPALIFAVLCFFSFDLLSFSPELLASSVLLVGLNFLFKEIEFRSERDEIILNLGVCLGIATLIVFSYVVFLIITIMILFIFTRPSIRKVLLLLFGFALPHLGIATLYYFRGDLSVMWYGFYVPNLTVHGNIWMSLMGLLLLSLVPLSYFLLSIFVLNAEARFTKYQSQLFQVMIFWMFAGFIQILITRDLSPRSLIIFIPSLSYFISHFLLLIKRKWLAESMLWIFLIGVIGVSLLGRYGLGGAANYSRMFPIHSPYGELVISKKVMMAVDDIDLYRHNSMGGYFLDWSTSQQILDHPEYYENVVLVDQSIAAGNPDVIVDPQDRMKGFFARIPRLRTSYVRDKDLYKKKIDTEVKKP